MFIEEIAPAVKELRYTCGMKEIELTDGVVRLVPFKLDYAGEHLAGDDEENIKWLSGGISSIDTVKDWILRGLESWENDGPVLTFAIFDVMENKLVGMTEANSNPEAIDGLNEGNVNISYNVYPFARGKGYATRAVLLLTEFLKEKRFTTALIRVHPDNRNSLGVPERARFIRTRLITTAQGEELIAFEKPLQ
ncbi:MAG: GNAT family N-acetyltransferase [Thermomicrobiales bacterium]